MVGTLSARQRVVRCTPCLRADVLATLETATLQNKTAFTGTHAHSEAVGVLSIPGLGLECPFSILSHLDISL